MATNYNHIAYSKRTDGREGFTTLYPHLNLEQHTEMLVDTSDQIVWGTKGDSTATITHESVSILGLPSIKDGVHVTQISKGQSGWSGRGKYFPVVSGGEYTHSVFLKNNGNTDVTINLQLGTSDSVTKPNPNVRYVNEKMIVPANSDWKLYSAVLTIPSDKSWAWSYVYTDTPTVTADFSFAGLKVEIGEVQTPWMPHESEVISKDYPTYIGTYTDENENSSTNPADYTWEMMNYRIYLDGIAAGGSKLLSAKVENLKPDTSYTIQVKQVSGEEESDFSDSVTFKTNVQK